MQQRGEANSNFRFNRKTQRAVLGAIEEERSLVITPALHTYVQCKRIVEMIIHDALIVHGHKSLAIDLHARLAVSGRLHSATERQLRSLSLKREVHRRSEADVPEGLGKDGSIEDGAVLARAEREHGVLVLIRDGRINALQELLVRALDLESGNEVAPLHMTDAEWEQRGRTGKWCTISIPYPPLRSWPRYR